jgi:hypothetical protein
MISAISSCLINAPWGALAAYSACATGCEILSSLFTKKSDEQQEKPKSSSLKDKAVSVLTKLTYPVLAYGIYRNSVKAFDMHYQAGMEASQGIPSPANPEDPRKLVVLLRQEWADEDIIMKYELIPYVQKLKQNFDVVVAEVDSITKLSKVMKSITHVGEKVKAISLLLFNGHGDKDGVFLSGKKQASLETILFPESLHRIKWERYLEKDAKIVLVSCETGSGSNPFAQALANSTGRLVAAPTGKIVHRFNLDVTEDVSSVALKYSGENQNTQELFEVPMKVFIPGQNKGKSSFGGFVPNENPLERWNVLEAVEGKSMVSDMLTKYMMTTIGLGVAGFCIKGTMFFAKYALGDRLKSATAMADKVGDSLIFTSDCMLGRSPSKIVRGLQMLFGSVVELEQKKNVRS